MIKNRPVVFVLLAISSAIALYIVLFNRGKDVQPTRFVTTVAGRNLPVLETLTRNDLDDTQKNSVKKAYREIEIAYLNNKVFTLPELMSKIPTCVTTMTTRVFWDLSGPLDAAWQKTFYKVAELRNFTNSEELKIYLDQNLLIARFLGETWLLRKDYSPELVTLELAVWKTLQRYKRKFHDERADDFERIVDSKISEWKKQIDSERGFTHAYLRFQLSLQRMKYDNGETSMDRLLEFVRSYASGLVSRGCTPSWLDEFK